MLSRCCKDRLFVEQGGEGIAYYVCEKCYHACDPLLVESKEMDDSKGQDNHDANAAGDQA